MAPALGVKHDQSFHGAPIRGATLPSLLPRESSCWGYPEQGRHCRVQAIVDGLYAIRLLTAKIVGRVRITDHAPQHPVFRFNADDGRHYLGKIDELTRLVFACIWIFHRLKSHGTKLLQGRHVHTDKGILKGIRSAQKKGSIVSKTPVGKWNT